VRVCEARVPCPALQKEKGKEEQEEGEGKEEEEKKKPGVPFAARPVFSESLKRLGTSFPVEKSIPSPENSIRQVYMYMRPLAVSTQRGTNQKSSKISRVWYWQRSQKPDQQGLT
jgi:hypothetical protein